MKSQAGLINFLTTMQILKRLSASNMVEFPSGTTPRVVKSTMAAESAGLSITVDRSSCLRLLVEAMLYGEPESYPHDWRMHLKIPGISLIDAKGLFDHLSKTGSVPK